jgi:hypothetical protein
LIQLSEHFSLQEMGQGIPAACVPTFTVMCTQILEPIRAYVQSAIYITSGYRSLQTNEAVHGQPNSEHMATADFCAVDFFCPKVQEVFAWLTLNPTLPYHQLILEKGRLGYVIHISINKLKPGVRSVLTGATENSQPYQQVAHVDFNPAPEVSA